MTALSVITVTHNRRDSLKRKLGTLKAQTLAPEQFEWIVCLNGDTEGAQTMLQNAETIFGVKTLEFPEQVGSSVARNACVKKASGSVLYFSDDDCLLDEGVLEAHLETQQARPCVAIGSILFQAESVSVWQPAKVNYWNTNGANTSVPKSSFETVGGFDENLQSYGGEDLLLGYRLHQQSLPFAALPEARVTHLGPNPAAGQDLSKARSAGRNAVQIARRYPQLAFRLGVHPLLLWLKRIALLQPFSTLWKGINANAFRYERAYLEGALEEKRHV